MIICVPSSAILAVFFPFCDKIIPDWVSGWVCIAINFERREEDVLFFFLCVNTKHYIITPNMAM